MIPVGIANLFRIDSLLIFLLLLILLPLQCFIFERNVISYHGISYERKSYHCSFLKQNEVYECSEAVGQYNHLLDIGRLKSRISKRKLPIFSLFLGVRSEDYNKERSGDINNSAEKVINRKIDNDYIDSAAELTDEEYEEVLRLAMGDGSERGEEIEREELNQKVKLALEDEWDADKGVNLQNSAESRKKMPLKANIDLLTYFAKEELTKGNITAAIELYEACIEYNPCDGRPWLGLARIHWKKRQINEAEKYYKDGLYYNPKNPYLLQSRAVMLEKLGDVNQAKTLLLTSVKNNPDHAASWCALATLNLRKGEVGAARYCYSSAVENSPKAYVALQAWGLLEEKEGNIIRARELYQLSIDASNGKSAYAYHSMATLERKQGDLKLCSEILQTALEKIPTNTRLRLSLAEITEMHGFRNKVLSIFKDGEESAARYGDAGYFQAWAMYEIRELETRFKMYSREELDGDRESYLFRQTLKPNFQDYNSFREEQSYYGKGNEKENVDNAFDHSVATVRSLFSKAVTVNKYHSASWVAWAKFEQKLGNLGNFIIFSLFYRV